MRQCRSRITFRGQFAISLFPYRNHQAENNHSVPGPGPPLWMGSTYHRGTMSGAGPAKTARLNFKYKQMRLVTVFIFETLKSGSTSVSALHSSEEACIDGWFPGPAQKTGHTADLKQGTVPAARGCGGGPPEPPAQARLDELKLCNSDHPGSQRTCTDQGLRASAHF
ncbi:hypothetical protein CEXT_536771 [Caerostris extrusa]|uniref:Uncharacterized protein n=1 Tax=Caerostris extrusa TaxID=172846 RepID=A0AAV4P8R4_CAEEX|nr:hypothetical protein CEXT_536771 [Caerostris extrusa]